MNKCYWLIHGKIVNFNFGFQTFWIKELQNKYKIDLPNTATIVDDWEFPRGNVAALHTYSPESEKVTLIKMIDESVSEVFFNNTLPSYSPWTENP